MSLIDIGIGFGLGFFLGMGTTIFYLRWKMQRQLGNIQEQMGAMADLSEEMENMMDPEEEMEMGDLGTGEVDIDTEEK